MVSGGNTRAESVKSGLAVIEGAEIVAVHDGVRPFVAPEEIDRTVQEAKTRGAAIMVAPVTDTIKRLDEACVVGTLDRGELRRALTPQCFRFATLKRAYDRLAELQAEGVEVPDDSFLVERLGISVFAVEGSARNIKITTEADLATAEALLNDAERAVRSAE